MTDDAAPSDRASRRSAWIAAIVAIGAGIALFAAATGAPEGSRPVHAATGGLDRLYTRAAEQAFGRRVLVVTDRPLDVATARIFESARAPSGWGLFAVSPPSGGPIVAFADALAAAVVRDWTADRSLSDATIRRLSRASVAVIVVEDGREAVVREDLAHINGLSLLPAVPGIRVIDAEPVFRVAADGSEWEPVSVLDYEDRSWGGALTIAEPHAGRYVITWPVAGGTFDVPGRSAPIGGGESHPFVELDLPAGSHRVTAKYSSGSSRGLVVGLAALALVVAAVVFLRSVRPDLQHEGG